MCAVEQLVCVSSLQRVQYGEYIFVLNIGVCLCVVSLLFLEW